MKFSILMPTLGRSSLAAAVQSIIDQSHQDWELLIHSAAKTVDWLIENTPPDPRIRYFHTDQQGCANALNVLTMHATGELLNFAADDDLMTPGALRLVASMYNLQPHRQWIVGRTITDSGSMQGGTGNLDALLHANFIPAPAAFWSRRLAAEVGPWDSAVDRAMDYDYWLRCMYAAGEPTFVPYTISLYREHPEQVTHLHAEEMRQHASLAREKMRKKLEATCG